MRLLWELGGLRLALQIQIGVMLVGSNEIRVVFFRLALFLGQMIGVLLNVQINWLTVLLALGRVFLRCIGSYRITLMIGLQRLALLFSIALLLDCSVELLYRLLGIGILFGFSFEDLVVDYAPVVVVFGLLSFFQ